MIFSITALSMVSLFATLSITFSIRIHRKPVMSFIMLSVVMLSVVMLSVVMLSVTII
jgi:hypothetical protein